jgi:hypothetical protein
MRSPHQNILCTSPAFHTRYTPRPPYFLYHENNITMKIHNNVIIYIIVLLWKQQQ